MNPSIVPIGFKQYANSIASTIYVASSAVVNGTRDGSFNAPYADLSFMATEPTTQAEYDLSKGVIILDTESYALPSTVAMGQWTIDLRAGFLTDAVGGTEWEIDSNLRFGSSTNPTFYVQRNNSVISTAWTGDGFTSVLRSGGSPVSLLRAGVAGLLRTGDFIIADGTNGGTSCATFPIFSMYRASFDASSTFKCRLALVSLTQALLNSSGDLEVGYISSCQNSTINATNILEARSSTSTKTIRDLTLNSSGGVTWDSSGSTRTWNVDAPSASEVLNKITSYPSNTINLIKVGAEAIGYDNSTSGLTADEVQAAIDELVVNLGDYLPLAGGTMAGNIDMDSNDIDNVNQVINDGASESRPAFLTGDAGWWGTNAKTMYLSISGSTIAALNLFGYNILSNDAMFGDLDQNSTGMGVYLDQGDSTTYLGDWRGTVSETYIEIDTATEYQRFYVGGVQVVDIQANSFEINKSLKLGSAVTVNASTYNIVGNESVIKVDYTATGVCTLQLPVITAAMDGSIIPVIDNANNAGTNKIVLNRGGTDTIEGSATSYEFLNDGEVHGFMADFTNNNWKVV